MIAKDQVIGNQSPAKKETFALCQSVRNWSLEQIKNIFLEYRKKSENFIKKLNDLKETENQLKNLENSFVKTDTEIKNKMDSEIRKIEEKFELEINANNVFKDEMLKKFDDYKKG